MDTTRNEQGFALIEVIVSAAVLAIVALAVLSGIDGATGSTARERARAVAGSLAEQDQERLRSFRFDALASVPQSKPMEVGGVNYTIKSEASWVNDDADATPACGDKSQLQAEYLRIVSTVTSTMVGARIPPVRLESLVAPSVKYAQDHGTLAVRVVNDKNVGQPGILVTAKPSTGLALAAETNSAGCALFRSVLVGTYTVSLNTPGYVDKTGKQATQATTGVNPNFVNRLTMIYDRKVSMTISVKTLRPGQAFTAANVAGANSSLTSAVSDNAANVGVLRVFRASPVGPFSTLTTPALFPFATAYSYFTGSCAYESPVMQGHADYFKTTNPGAAVIGNPAAPGSQPATVFQPALNLRIRNDSISNTPPSNFDAVTNQVNVYATLIAPSDDDCVDVENQQLSTVTWPGGAWGTSPPISNPTANQLLNWVSDGTPFDPGMPFGKYTICLRDQNADSRGRATYKYYKATYDNTSPNGQATTVELPPTSAKTTDWTTTNCAA